MGERADMTARLADMAHDTGRQIETGEKMLVKKSTLETERAGLCVQTASLQAQIQNMQQELVSLAHADKERTANLALKKQQEKPAVAFYQHMFGLAIHPVRSILYNTDGEIKFIFTNINQNDWNQEFWFVLHVVDKVFSVDSCFPAVPELKSMVEWLNSCNRLEVFLKMMRQAFVQVAEAAK